MKRRFRGRPRRGGKRRFRSGRTKRLSNYYVSRGGIRL